jgi:hypothetical protein
VRSEREIDDDDDDDDDDGDDNNNNNNNNNNNSQGILASIQSPIRTPKDLNMPRKL